MLHFKEDFRCCRHFRIYCFSPNQQLIIISRNKNIASFVLFLGWNPNWFEVIILFLAKNVISPCLPSLSTLTVSARERVVNNLIPHCHHSYK